MKPELQKTLFDIAPTLFRHMAGDPKDWRYWGVCWGSIDCGDGWFALLRDGCKRIEHICRGMEANEMEPCWAVQVKEKFGTLRFYIYNDSRGIDDVIREMERESARTCECCGGAADGQTVGWIHTLCRRCAKNQDTVLDCDIPDEEEDELAPA